MGLNKDVSLAYPVAVRWLHVGIAAGAVFQLLTSLILLPPDEKGSVFAHTMMQAHEVGGLVVAVFVALHLVWSLLVHKAQHSSMWILLERNHWRESFSLIKMLPRALLGKTDMPEPGSSLARIVGMLGILLMAAMGATGVAIWFGLPEHSLIMPPGVDLLMNVHSLLSNVLWAYVIGHVSMALAHTRGGDQVIKRISPF